MIVSVSRPTLTAAYSECGVSCRQQHIAIAGASEVMESEGACTLGTAAYREGWHWQCASCGALQCKRDMHARYGRDALCMSIINHFCFLIAQHEHSVLTRGCCPSFPTIPLTRLQNKRMLFHPLLPYSIFHVIKLQEGGTCMFSWMGTSNLKTIPRSGRFLNVLLITRGTQSNLSSAGYAPVRILNCDVCMYTCFKKGPCAPQGKAANGKPLLGPHNAALIADEDIRATHDVLIQVHFQSPPAALTSKLL
eukprot:1072107-Pelagomonas_calceolata.AAC.2